jgi:hypothetical protein
MSTYTFASLGAFYTAQNNFSRDLILASTFDSSTLVLTVPDVMDPETLLAISGTNSSSSPDRLLDRIEGIEATIVSPVSADAGNLITADAGGSAYLDGAAVRSAETVTVLSYNPSTKGLQYQAEDLSISLIDLSGLEFTTTLAYDPGTYTFTYTDEDGVGTNITIDTSSHIHTILDDAVAGTIGFGNDIGTTTVTLTSWMGYAEAP